MISRILVAAFLLPIHEVAHGWVAYKMGDPTAKWMGRLTLNPVKHLDPIGSVLLVLIGYGWAKPVPINARNFKNPKKGMAITAAAGPIANILVALIFVVIYKVVSWFYIGTGVAFLFTLSDVLLQITLINVGLAVFNLFPVPPLDGSRIVGLFLPERIYFQIMQYERYIMIAFMAVIMFTTFLDPIFNYGTKGLLTALDFITGFIDLIGRAVVG